MLGVNLGRAAHIVFRLQWFQTDTVTTPFVLTDVIFYILDLLKQNNDLRVGKQVFHLIIWAVEATGKLLLKVDLRGGLLQEVWNPLDQEVSVLKVGKQESHTVLGADGEWAGQHVGAVCLLHNGHLEENSQTPST